MADPSSVSVLIPAFNEAQVIGEVVARVRAAAPWREVIVVDDGSTDGTAERAAAAGATVARHPYNAARPASSS
jgi:glycosyltransferase involved in cell wall biosynthesis